MYLLYLDDAGSIMNADEEYFILGGICVHESKLYYLNQYLDNLAKEINPADPNVVEFHASEIFSRRIEPWKSMTRQESVEIIQKVLDACNKEYSDTCIFACAVHKSSYASEDAVELAFIDLCSRFDYFIQRIYHHKQESHAGIIILDESTHETTLQTLASGFRHDSTLWQRVIRNIQEVPLFVDSKASRLIQLADHIAYAVFRRYEASDIKYFDVIQSRFDSEDGTIHGLCHKHRFSTQCTCPFCLTRQSSSQK